jgi:hypothetical protein
MFILRLANSDSFVALSQADYELVRHLPWHLEDECWAATELNGELIEMGIYIKRARGEAPLSPAPWRDKLN